MNGPLQGLRVIELAGLGPAPFAGMMLAHMGAQVLRIVRPDFDPQRASPALPATIDSSPVRRWLEQWGVDADARAMLTHV